MTRFLLAVLSFIPVISNAATLSLKPGSHASILAGEKTEVVCERESVGLPREVVIPPTALRFEMTKECGAIKALSALSSNPQVGVFNAYFECAGVKYVIATVRLGQYSYTEMFRLADVIVN